MAIRTILVVDDNADLREPLKAALELEGYRVRAAASAQEALALQSDSPADVLVSDIFMPDMDGMELIDRFRALYPRTAIVAMSGDARYAHRQNYLHAAELLGVATTLKKPFEISALLEALERIRAK